MSQLTEFDIGQIKAHRYHKLSALTISQILVKPGTGRKKEYWTEGAIQRVINKLEAEPSWRGEREEGSGAPRKTTKAQDDALYKYVTKPGRRGMEKVTVAVLRKHFLWARKLSNTLLEERLYEAGLRWLRRRNKSGVTSQYLPERIRYCNWVLTLPSQHLMNWGYTDGICFYLDRTRDQNEHTQIAAVGSMVWRHADHRDAMHQECLCPSAYQSQVSLPGLVGVFSLG